MQDNDKNEKSPASQENSQIKDVIIKVLEDEEFRNQLITNPDEALASFELSETQILLLKTLSKEDLEKLTPENVEEFFVADAAVYTPDLDEDAIDYDLDDGDFADV